MINRGISMIAATCMVAAIGLAQQPFDLDPAFVTNIATQGVGSIAVLEDGDVLLSGSIRFPGDEYDRNTARLNPNGARELTYPEFTYGGGKLVPWDGRFFVGNGQGIRRIWPDGMADTDFQGLDLDPYIHLLQGGDYHVFPDGRLLITGTHEVTDTARGFNGLYNLIWITPEGRLDTTRIHRRGNGDLDTILELVDGTFLIGGGLTQYEGHPVGDIIHVFADGSLDTTFNTTVYWNWPACFLPLPGGKVLCGGDMLFEGIADTMHLVRLNADGSLDESFNNHLNAVRSYDLDGKAPVASITAFGTDKYIITGYWDYIDGQPRGGIAVLDTAGLMLDDLFAGGGCGTFWDGFSTLGAINGLTQAADGSFYVYGYYHGYDDGTTNDEDQRMVSRLYGLEVGVGEPPMAEALLSVVPNSATTHLKVAWSEDFHPSELSVQDVTGRLVLSVRAAVMGAQQLEVSSLLTGVYVVSVLDKDRTRRSARFVIER